MASIPVITKKKRSPDTSVHGRWMCTVNKAGEPVHYSISEASSSINVDNPETWIKGCDFRAPMNVSTFNIVAIGAGGGGASGAVIIEW